MREMWSSLAQHLYRKVYVNLKNKFSFLCNKKLFEGVGNGRSRSSQREEKLPSLAQVNREITELSSELVGRRAMEPGELVEWISDKRGAG